MKKRVKKCFVGMMLSLGMMMTLTNQGGIVKAADEMLSTTKGVATFSKGDASIEIKANNGQSLVGKTLYLYKLFDAKNAEDLSSINYKMNETYASAMKSVVARKINKSVEDVTEYDVIDYIQSLNSYVVEGAQAEQTLESTYSDYRYFIEELLEEFRDLGLSGTKISVESAKSDGSIEVEGLEYGYYMIEDATIASGKHTAVSLAMLGTANPDASIRIKSDYPTVTKKIQEDDNRDKVGQEGWNDLGDFEIGQDVPYRYESMLPNMNGYATYYYAWHDRMDEALTLQEDSIQITIQGTINSSTKEYQLSSEEYQLVTDSDAETFKIEVSNIKGIVDREFNQINERNENIYDQKVIVSYMATLNDNAALDTGRPGFENEVRLEFSNNPNSTGEGETGYTPWDTVVCFTYELDGVKVNNYGKELEGAEFRLYYDETCEEEVYVKESGNGYIVMNQDSWNGSEPQNAVSMVSDRSGLFTIYGLDSGIYYLKEVSAPDGYRQLLEPIRVTITATFPQERNDYVKGDGAKEETLQLTAAAHIVSFVDGKDKVEDVVLATENGSINLSVVNEIGKKLPVTGSYGMLILVGTGVVLMGMSLKKGKKKHA